jgi:uncharacterized membrane protein
MTDTDLVDCVDSDGTNPSKRPFRTALIGSVVILAAAAILSLWAWGKIGPDARIPIHWNAKGEADGFAGRIGIWYTVIGIAVLTLLLAVVPLLEPRKGHLLQSSRAYQALWLGTTAFMAMLHAIVVFSALGHEVSINRWICIGLGVFFAVIGNYLGKTRSNFIFGIRTPWTLSSELSWQRTHRLGGRLFLLFGLAVLALGIFNISGQLLFYSLVAGVLVVVPVPLIYSYVVWKNDPERNSG